MHAVLSDPRRTLLRTVLAALGLYLCAPDPVRAHPHVFVSGKSEIVVSAGGTIQAIRHAWTFDEWFSSAAIVGLDTNKDGNYTREELAPLAKINVESLSEYAFFTFLAKGKEDDAGKFSEPVDYRLDYANGQLTLHFTLPLKTPLKATDATVELEVYDPEYYVAFTFAETDAVSLAQGAPRCALTLDRGKGPDAVQQTYLSQFKRDEVLPDPNFGALFAEKVSIRCP